MGDRQGEARDRDEEGKSSTARSALAWGWILVLLGACSGLLSPVTPLVGVAHKIGVLEGLLLIALSATVPYLELSKGSLQVLLFLFVLQGYSNWGGSALAAWSGAGPGPLAGGYDASFASGLKRHAGGGADIVALLLNGAFFVVPAVALLLVGLLRRGDRSKRRQARFTRLACAVSAVTLLAVLWLSASPGRSIYCAGARA
jgi:hypothetical protein